MYEEAAGPLAKTSSPNSESAPKAKQALPLSSPSLKDLELPINVLGERVAFQVTTNQSGAWFRLQKFTPSVRVDPWSPVRGVNKQKESVSSSESVPAATAFEMPRGCFDQG